MHGIEAAEPHMLEESRIFRASMDRGQSVRESNFDVSLVIDPLVLLRENAERNDYNAPPPVVHFQDEFMEALRAAERATRQSPYVDSSESVSATTTDPLNANDASRGGDQRQRPNGKRPRAGSSAPRPNVDRFRPNFEGTTAQPQLRTARVARGTSNHSGLKLVALRQMLSRDFSREKEHFRSRGMDLRRCEKRPNSGKTRRKYVINMAELADDMDHLMRLSAELSNLCGALSLYKSGLLQHNGRLMATVGKQSR